MYIKLSTGGPSSVVEIYSLIPFLGYKLGRLYNIDTNFGTKKYSMIHAVNKIYINWDNQYKQSIEGKFSKLF